MSILLYGHSLLAIFLLFFIHIYSFDDIICLCLTNSLMSHEFILDVFHTYFPFDIKINIFYRYQFAYWIARLWLRRDETKKLSNKNKNKNKKRKGKRRNINNKIQNSNENINVSTIACAFWGVKAAAFKIWMKIRFFVFVFYFLLSVFSLQIKQKRKKQKWEY